MRMRAEEAEAKWEVAITNSESNRLVLATGVDTSQLFAYIAAALEEPLAGEPAAVLVTRLDSLPQSWKERQADLVDTTVGLREDGTPFTRRKVRYGKMSMKDWDLMCRLNRWRPKKKKTQIGTVMCRNGDAQCACLVLTGTCRLEV